MVSMRESSLRDSHSAYGAVPVLEERGKSIRRGTLARPLCDGFNGLIAQSLQEVGFHVGMTTWWEKRLKEALHLDIAHAANHVCHRRAKPSQRSQYPFTL